ncbi:MAG: A24 family peptidase [Moraxellaceae bacterium]|nr:A24 family peptidase [Moraxellaceae bacterium]
MLELLQQPAGLMIVCGLLGLCVGSFLNVVIHRVPKMLEQRWLAEAAYVRGEPEPEAPAFNLVKPRSRCPHCGHLIGAIENIPVVSYLFLKGRCKACKARISPRYPLVEILTALLSVAVGWQFGPTLATAAALAFVWALVALTFIDLDTQLLPDDITLPLVWLGLLANVWTSFTTLESAVIGAMAGYLVLWSVYWLFKLTTGKEGMGYGDFKLLAAVGAWLGWQVLPVVVLLSSVVGAVVGIGLIVFARHGRETPIPFGPYLAAAGLIALFFGPQLSRQFFML